jgi:hypothetical protein
LPPASVVFGDREEDQFEGESDYAYAARTGVLRDPYKRAVKGLLPEQKSSQKFEDDGVTPFEVRDPGPRDEGEGESEDFSRYRYARGHEVEGPAMLQKNTAFTPEDVSSVAKDVGIAAMHSNVSAPVTQAVFDLVGESYSPPSNPEGWDADTCMSDLRAMAGDGADELAAAAAKFTQNKPALRSWLEETSMGNHGKTVALLGLLGTYPDLGTPEGAEKFLAQLWTNEKMKAAYTGRDHARHKLVVLAASLAHAVVAASGKKQ